MMFIIPHHLTLIVSRLSISSVSNATATSATTYAGTELSVGGPVSTALQRLLDGAALQDGATDLERAVARLSPSKIVKLMDRKASLHTGFLTISPNKFLRPLCLPVPTKVSTTIDEDGNETEPAIRKVLLGNASPYAQMHHQGFVYIDETIAWNLHLANAADVEDFPFDFGKTFTIEDAKAKYPMLLPFIKELEGADGEEPPSDGEEDEDGTVIAKYVIIKLPLFMPLLPSHDVPATSRKVDTNHSILDHNTEFSAYWYSKQLEFKQQLHDVLVDPAHTSALQDVMPKKPRGQAYRPSSASTASMWTASITTTSPEISPTSPSRWPTSQATTYAMRPPLRLHPSQPSR